MKTIADIEKTCSSCECAECPYFSHDYNLCAFKVLEPKHWAEYGVCK